MMGVYGVFMFHLEKFFRFVNIAQKKKLGWRSLFKFWWFEWDDIVRSLFWFGIVVVYDDEILGKYNDWAQVDIQAAASWHYFLAGFGIDRIIVNVKKKANFFDRKIDITLYK
jgi:hypothetical protein